MGNSMGGAPYGSCDAETTRGNPGKRKERYGSDDRVDGREIVENSMGRAPVGRSDTGMTTGWTEGKPWEISLGRAPLGRSDTGMTTGWTEGKPWEIARGELRSKGAIRKR